MPCWQPKFSEAKNFTCPVRLRQGHFVVRLRQGHFVPTFHKLRSEGWCGRRGLNPQGNYPPEWKSGAFASFATPAHLTVGLGPDRELTGLRSGPAPASRPGYAASLQRRTPRRQTQFTAAGKDPFPYSIARLGLSIKIQQNQENTRGSGCSCDPLNTARSQERSWRRRIRHPRRGPGTSILLTLFNRAWYGMAQNLTRLQTRPRRLC
jgi:hypothetical protein